MNTDATVVILAGGEGSRMRPYTRVLPKPLIPVCDVPILEIVIHQLRQQGFRRIIFAVNYHEALLRSYFGDGSSFGVDIRYSVEDHALGTIGPLRLVKDRLSDHFLVMNGDLLSDVRYVALLEAHRRSGTVLTVGTHRRSVRINDGVIETDKNGQITRFQEKPTINVSVSMGIYAMSRAVLGFLPHGQACGMDDLILTLLRSRQSINTFRHDGEWYGIGTPTELEKANAALTERRSRFLPDERTLVDVA